MKLGIVHIMGKLERNVCDLLPLSFVLKGRLFRKDKCFCDIEGSQPFNLTMQYINSDH